MKVKVGDTISLKSGTRKFRVTHVLMNTDNTTVKGYLAHPLKARFFEADDVKVIKKKDK